MGENTAISWADHTFNPWIGCQKVGPPCDHCYAEAWAKARRPEIEWGPHGTRVMTADSSWAQPLAWNRKAEAAGVPAIVFGGSLCDWADNRAPKGARERYGRLIEATPWLRYILLTKRPGYMDRAIEELGGWRPNIWTALTVGDQEDADRDLPLFLERARYAALRMVSYGPALGPLELGEHLYRFACPDCFEGKTRVTGHFFDEPCPSCRGTGCEQERIDFVAAEGESGPGARPAHPDWFRKVRDDCAAAGVPFDFKQWGEWLPGQNEVYPDWDGRRVAHHQDGTWGTVAAGNPSKNYATWEPDGTLHFGYMPTWEVEAWSRRVGKKAAGCQLDGVEHHARPALP